MSLITTSVKRQNHRVHPCSLKQKSLLLKSLLEKYKDLSLFILKSDSSEELADITNENVTILSDKELADSTELQCDILISYNLPENEEDYMVRLSRAKSEALILLDPNEQKQLHSIERLIGRSLIQEIVIGFEPAKTLAEQKRDFKNKKFSGDKSRNSFSNSKSYGDREYKKPYNATKDSSTSTQKRKPRTINVKSLKPKVD